MPDVVVELAVAVLVETHTEVADASVPLRTTVEEETMVAEEEEEEEDETMEDDDETIGETQVLDVVPGAELLDHSGVDEVVEVVVGVQAGVVEEVVGVQAAFVEEVVGVQAGVVLVVVVVGELLPSLYHHVTVVTPVSRESKTWKRASDMSRPP